MGVYRTLTSTKWRAELEAPCACDWHSALELLVLFQSTIAALIITFATILGGVPYYKYSMMGPKTLL